MYTPCRPCIILMADDDEDDRMLAQEALAEAQLTNELHCVEDGEELLDYLYRQGKYAALGNSLLPGLILLDLNMPKKDGREALQAIKADPVLRRIPVVVLTTSRLKRTSYAPMTSVPARSLLSQYLLKRWLRS